MRRLMVLILLACTLIITQAQDGHGLIRVGIVHDLDTQFTSFNPLLCNDAACSQAIELLFPTLLASDYDTGWFTAGTQGNNALAVDWTISDDKRIYTFQLRDDAFWSDGTPITAYDYFYAFLMAGDRVTQNPYFRSIAREGIEGVVPLSNTELAVIMKEANCDKLPYLDMTFIPTHVFDETFTANAAIFFADGGSIDELWSAWDESFEYDFSFMRNLPFNDAPSVTGDYFQFVDWDHRDHIRLQRGDVALELVPFASDSQMLDHFLSRDINVILSIPVERIADLSHNPNVELYASDAPIWDYLAFNLADTKEPMSAFDDDGNPLEQGEHPILGDINIRRAIQMGIDRESLIDIALHGQATLIPAMSAPTSWIFDDKLSSPEFDPDEAERLLDEAGWVKVGNRSIRECVNCGVVDDGTRLSLSLAYTDTGHYPVAAIVIQQQLRRIGIEINAYASDMGEARRQSFDLFLGAWFDTYPTIPRLDLLFTPESDVLSTGYNISSYNNPDVTALIEQAQTLSGCDLSERQALYVEAQALIQEDLPFAWLYSPTWTSAVEANIQNVEVKPFAPFWNIDDWVVFDVH